MDPANSLLMRAHMNQYVAEEISDTSILGRVDWSDRRGTTALSLTFANFRFPSPVSWATYCFNDNNEFCGSTSNFGHFAHLAAVMTKGLTSTYNQYMYNGRRTD